MFLFPRHLPTPTPSLSDFTLQCKLGKGTYGYVSKYVHNKTKLPYAIKQMSYKNKSTSEVLMIQKQIQILYRIKNEYVVQLIDHFEDVANGDIYLIMEHIEGEDLFKSIYDKKVQLEVSDIARVLYQICSALIQLHANSIIHRDLKLENVIYLPNKSIKLVDLGCSNYYGQDYQRLTKIGTRIYYSPELIMGDGQDDRLDVWCLGVLTYELLFLRSPFPNKDLQQKIKKLDYDIPVSSDRHEDEDLVDMFKKIFCYKDKRIRAHQLIKHPWIQKNKGTIKPTVDTELFGQEELRRLKLFYLDQIASCEKHIEQLKEDNEHLRRKVNFEEGTTFEDDCF